MWWWILPALAQDPAVEPPVEAVETEEPAAERPEEVAPSEGVEAEIAAPEEDVVTVEELDELWLELELAREEFDAMGAELEDTRAELELTREELAATQQDLELAEQELVLADAEITAELREAVVLPRDDYGDPLPLPGELNPNDPRTFDDYGDVDARNAWGELTEDVDRVPDSLFEDVNEEELYQDSDPDDDIFAR